jgi:hypothetical protein
MHSIVGYQVLLGGGWFKLESFGHSSFKSKIADWALPAGLLYGSFEP